MISVILCFRWFHGKLDRKKAESLLKPGTNGLFLVRASVHFPGDYTLSVFFQNKVEHYHISLKNRKYTIDNEEFYDNLTVIVEVT